MYQEEYPNPYEAIYGNTDVQSYFNPPKEGNTTTFSPTQQGIPEPPQMNPIQPVPAQVQVRTTPTAEERIAEMMGQYPEPTYPKASQDRINRIMKVKALGEGLGALGDIFALSQGALVNRRQPDQTIGRYRQMYEQREDEYLRRMDDHNRQKLNQQIQAMIYGQNRADRREDIDYRKERDAKGDQFRTETFEWQKERHAEAERKADERYVAETKAAEERYKKQYGLDWQRNKIAQEKWDIEKKMLEDQALFEASGGRIKPNANGFNLYTSDGKGQAVMIESKGELQKLYTMIVNHYRNSPDFAERMNLLKPSMGSPGNKNEQELIVGEYWEKTPAVIEFLRNTGKLEPAPAPQPQTNSYLQGLGVTPRSAPASPMAPAATPATPTTPPAQQPVPQEPVPQKEYTLPGLGGQNKASVPNIPPSQPVRPIQQVQIDTSAILQKYPENVRNDIQRSGKTTYTLAVEMAKGKDFNQDKGAYDRYVRELSAQIAKDRDALNQAQKVNQTISQQSAAEVWAEQNPDLAKRYGR